MELGVERREELPGEVTPCTTLPRQFTTYTPLWITASHLPPTSTPISYLLHCYSSLLASISLFCGYNSLLCNASGVSRVPQGTSPAK